MMKNEAISPPNSESRSPAIPASGLRALEPHELKRVSGGDGSFPPCRPGERSPDCIKRPD